jgi:uracil-DNA glycosylase family 4
MSSTVSRKVVFLDEMGLGPLWTRRSAAPATPHDDAPYVDVDEASEPVQPIVAAPSAWPQSGNTYAEMPGADTQAPSAAEIAGMDWTQLQTAVAGCVKCDLCRSRKKTVFGVGDLKAKWLFVGEGPGRNEDLQGEPFVGPAGKLLDNMLLAMGLKRGENAYIANIVKCRPTDADGRDRPPTPEEVAACIPYLNRQIALLQPSIVVALGKTAALSLLKLDPATPVSKLRGNVHRYGDLPLVVTYHPAYLLRSPADKRKTWADLCLAMTTYGGNST